MHYNSVTQVNSAMKNDPCGELHEPGQMAMMDPGTWRDMDKNHQQRTTNQHFTDTPMFKAMYPFFFSMKLVGLFHVKEFSPSGKVTKSFLYSVIVMIILGLQVCQNGFVFNLNDSFGPTLFTKVLFCSWHINCALNNVGCFRACYYYNHIPALFMKWAIIRHPTTDCFKYTRRKTVAYTTVCCLGILVNIGFTVYGLYYTSIFDNALQPIGPTHPFVNIYKGVIVVVTVYLSSAWIFPVALTMLVCSVLHFEFTTLTKDLMDCASNMTSVAELDLDTHRLRHQQLCRLVGHADDFLSLHLAINIT